jgi:hypothetical protein
MEVAWTNHVKNGEELLRLKEKTKIKHIKERRKILWIGHILRRNCLLQHVTKERIEARIEVKGRRVRRLRQALDNLKEKREYWKLG